MSLPECRIELSPRARHDVVDILRQTARIFGPAQVAIYRAELDMALSRLAADPTIGRSSPYLPPTHRLLGFASHIVVYRRRGDVVGIARILHRRMNWADRVKDP